MCRKNLSDFAPEFGMGSTERMKFYKKETKKGKVSGFGLAGWNHVYVI